MTLLFEGLTISELLDLPDEHFQALILTDEVLVFRVGSAEVLGKFKVEDDTLILELAQIDDGGEGVLVGLSSLAHQYAARHALKFVEWRVHAIHCAKPNLRLRRVLELKGFQIRDVAGVGDCYQLRTPTQE